MCQGELGREKYGTHCPFDFGQLQNWNGPGDPGWLRSVVSNGKRHPRGCFLGGVWQTIGLDTRTMF